MLDLTQYHNDSHIDSAGLHSLLDEAQAERDERTDAAEDVDADESPLERADLDREVQVWDAEYGENFTELRDVCDGLPSSTQLIRDDCMEQYLDDLLESCGDIPSNLPHYITITVDYDALKSDYNTTEYGSNTYYWRD